MRLYFLVFALCAATARRLPDDHNRAAGAHFYEHIYAVASLDIAAAEDELALTLFELAQT